MFSWLSSMSEGFGVQGLGLSTSSQAMRHGEIPTRPLGPTALGKIYVEAHSRFEVFCFRVNLLPGTLSPIP